MAESRGYALPLEHELDDFRITQVLGQGGFGITYKAMDVRLQREVAIKEFLPREYAYRGEDLQVLPRDDSAQKVFEWGLRRFIDEARTLAKFRHPNIVEVDRYLEANGTAYLVMDYEEGRDFEAWLDLRPEGVAEDVLVHRVLLPVLDGLEKVHEKGLLHRDIKPENIFMRRDGTPVLIDFGASRAHGEDTTAKLTSIISAGYSPCEQYGGVGRQGPWTDLYALAGTLYRVIAGRKPTDAIARQQGEALIPAVEAGRGCYSRAFLSAIDCALALDPKKRPQTAAAFRDMVREGAAQVAEAGDRSETLVRSHQAVMGPAKRIRGPLWWGLGATGSVLAVSALAIMVLREPLSPPHGTDQERPTADGQNVATAEDNAAAILLTGSDPEGGPLTFAVASPPAHGALSGAAPNVTYTPNPDYSGTDSFSFTVSDGLTDSAPATVNLIVDPVDDAPPTDPLDNEPYVVTAANGANVRSGPGTDYPVVMTMASGQRFDAIARLIGANWYEIGRDGVGQGWVHGDLIDPAAAVAQETQEPDDVATGVVVDTQNPTQTPLGAADGDTEAETAPQDPESRFQLARTYHKEDRQDDAIRVLEELLEEDYRPADVAEGFAALVANYQPEPERLRKARYAIQRLPDYESNFRLLDALGWIYYRLGDFEQAIRVLEEAVELGGDEPIYHYHLGMAYFRADRLEDARAQLEKAVGKSAGQYTGIEEARETLAQLPKDEPRSGGESFVEALGAAAGVVIGAKLAHEEEQERERQRRDDLERRQAQSPQWILRCVFPNDANAYVVSDRNDIFSFPPHGGQGTLIGKKIDPTVAGYDWMYQTASFTYGVLNNVIYSWAPDGTPFQVGYVTHP